jgi:hypothetical protein
MPVSSAPPVILIDIYEEHNLTVQCSIMPYNIVFFIISANSGSLK